LRRVMIPGLALAAVCGAVFLGDWLASRWHKGFAPYYDGLFGGRIVTEVTENTPPLTKVCVLHYRPYPFFRSRRQVRLCQPILVPSYRWFWEYLGERQATFVVVEAIESPSPDNRDRYQSAYQWATEHPEVFAPFGLASSLCVFRVELSPHR